VVGKSDFALSPAFSFLVFLFFCCRRHTFVSRSSSNRTIIWGEDTLNECCSVTRVERGAAVPRAYRPRRSTCGYEAAGVPKLKHSPVMAIEILLICVGALAFFAVLLRLT
jgi:hypothetical protein